MKRNSVLKAVEKAGATIEHKSATHFIARFAEKFIEFSGDNGTDDAFALWVGSLENYGWEDVNQTWQGSPSYTIKSALKYAQR